MPEKKLSYEELDKKGLPCIEIDWDNKQKLSAMFHRNRLANHTYCLKFQGNKLSILGSGLHSSSRQTMM